MCHVPFLNSGDDFPGQGSLQAVGLQQDEGLLGVGVLLLLIGGLGGGGSLVALLGGFLLLLCGWKEDNKRVICTLILFLLDEG